MTVFGSADHRIHAALRSNPEWIARIISRLVGYPSKTDCWIWGRSLSNGYGRASLPAINGECHNAQVHRIVWIYLVGPIPENHVLDHDGPSGCGNRACSNPAHLQAVTNWHNTVASGSSGASAVNARRTHCPAGHPLEAGNLVAHLYRRGRRICLACKRERGRRLYASKVNSARLLGLTVSEYRRAIKAGAL